MGVIASLMSYAESQSGFTALAGTLWFSRVPDTLTDPPACVLIDEGRDPLIRDAIFEGAQATLSQVEVYNFRFELWTVTLVDAEAWAAIMDNAFAFGQFTVPGYTTLEEAIEVGRVEFDQEKFRDSSVDLSHHVVYPVTIPIQKNAGA